MSDPIEPSIEAVQLEPSIDVTGNNVQETSIINPLEKSEETTLVVKKKKRRPARVQKEPGTVQDQLPQSGTVFNIWYLKWYVIDLLYHFYSVVLFF